MYIKMLLIYKKHLSDLESEIDALAGYGNFIIRNVKKENPLK